LPPRRPSATAAGFLRFAMRGILASGRVVTCPLTCVQRYTCYLSRRRSEPSGNDSSGNKHCGRSRPAATTSERTLTCSAATCRLSFAPTSESGDSRECRTGCSYALLHDRH
jgi:hypothetical protein